MVCCWFCLRVGICVCVLFLIWFVYYFIVCSVIAVLLLFDLFGCALALGLLVWCGFWMYLVVVCCCCLGLLAVLRVAFVCCSLVCWCFIICWYCLFCGVCCCLFLVECLFAELLLIVGSC